MAVIDPQASESESKGEDDHAAVVDRTAPGESQDDHTVLVDRIAVSEEQTDHTIVVDNSARAKPGTSRDRTARKRRIAPPPVPSGFAPQAVKAAGADAREHYLPRRIPAPPTPAPPTPAPDSEAGPAATREASATMPSVTRNSRVTARAAVVVFVASCVVSAVGLTLIAFALAARF